MLSQNYSEINDIPQNIFLAKVQGNNICDILYQEIYGTLYTNGYRSLVNVNISAGENTRVYDDTIGQALDFTLGKDNSVNFWVENNYTSSIYMDAAE